MGDAAAGKDSASPSADEGATASTLEAGDTVVLLGAEGPEQRGQVVDPDCNGAVKLVMANGAVKSYERNKVAQVMRSVLVTPCRIVPRSSRRAALCHAALRKPHSLPRALTGPSW